MVLSVNATSACRAAGSDFVPVTDRLLRIRLRIHSGYVSVISVYAPTNEKENVEESECFYYDLQVVVSSVTKRDMCWSGVILMQGLVMMLTPGMVSLADMVQMCVTLIDSVYFFQ